MKNKYIISALLLLVLVGMYFSYKTWNEGNRSLFQDEVPSVTTANINVTIPIDTTKDDAILAAKIAKASDIYVKYNNNFYSRIDGTYNFTKVVGADLETFKVISNGYGYAKDKNLVYYYGKPTDLDPKTVTFLGDFWVNDNTNVYFNQEKIVGADAATFIALGEIYSYIRFAKDKNNVFFQQAPVVMEPKELPAPDSASFTLIDSAYAKDSSRVYYIARYNSSIGISVIKEADPKTFESLGSVITDKGTKNYAYAKDRSHVYFFDKPLPGVDVATFEFVNSPGCNDTGCSPVVTKDKNCIYHDTKKVLGAEGVCVSPIQCTKATINTSCGIK